MGGGHALERFARDQEGTVDIDVEGALEPCGAVVDKGAHPTHHTGIVNQCGQGQATRIKGGEHRQDVVFVGDIGLHGKPIAAGGFDACAHAQCGSFVTDVIDGDRIAARGTE